MWIALLLLWQLSPPAHVRLVRDNPVATVTGLTAVHRGGQTFLTGTKNSGSTGSTTYGIRRSASAFTSSADGTLLITLTANSYRLLHNDDPGTLTNGENLTSGFVVTDDGSHLASTQILAVITTHSGETGTWHYAAFSSDDPTTVAAGVNTTSVAETYQAVPGAIHLGSTVVGGYTCHRYYAWEDLRTWVHSEWGYYGHRFNVMKPTSGSNFAILLLLHGGGTSGYWESERGGFHGAVTIRPTSLDFGSTTDPYTGGAHPAPWWLFQFDTAADLYKTSSMDQVVRYTQMVRDNLTGDGVDYQVNANRVYIEGASGGSSGIHIAAHHPEVFTAATAGLPWVDNTTAGGGSVFDNPTKKVNAIGGDALGDYFDLAYQAARVALPPLMHLIGAVDATITPAPYTNALAVFETYHQPYFAEWKNVGHDGGFGASYAQWDSNSAGGYLRFLKNEAYPAFGLASTSTTIPTFPNASAGHRNGTLDWYGGGHTISGGSAIAETSTTFAISLISSSASTGTTVTIRNQQTFLPTSGATITYSTSNGQSGSATRNSDGSVTLTNLTIPTSAMRLTLTATEPAGGSFASVFSSVLR